MLSNQADPAGCPNGTMQWAPVIRSYFKETYMIPVGHFGSRKDIYYLYQ